MTEKRFVLRPEMPDVRFRLLQFVENLEVLRPTEVLIRRYRNKRSLAQNAYYWGVVVKTISEITGYLPDEVHELLKQTFLPTRAVTIGRRTVVVSGSSAILTTAEFKRYIEEIQMFAAMEIGVDIPDPDASIYVGTKKVRILDWTRKAA